MRRVELANAFALAAREAERGGKHRRAAELYAEALRVLLDRSATSSGKAEVRSEAAGDQRGAPVSEAREVAQVSSGAGADDEARIEQTG